MKVLFLRDNNIVSDSRVLKETSSLAKQNHQVSVVGWDEQKKNRPDAILSYDAVNIPVHYLTMEMSYKFKYFKVWAYLCFEIALMHYLFQNKQKIDVIHACNLHTGLIAVLFAKITHKKLVYDIFDFSPDTRHYPSFFRSVLKRLEFFTINKADAVIICSDERKNQIVGSRPKKLVVIYNSPKSVANNLTDAQSEEHYTVAYVGGLSPYRLLPELLKVIADDHSLNMIIGGFGHYKQLVEKYVTQNKGINFLGEVPYAEVEKIESHADVLVALYDPMIKNHKYASPNKFFESFQLGKPLIMIKGTGMSSWLTRLNVGAVVEPTEAGIRLGLKTILANKNNWKRDQALMQKTFNTEFAWQKMDERLTNIYLELARK